MSREDYIRITTTAEVTRSQLEQLWWSCRRMRGCIVDLTGAAVSLLTTVACEAGRMIGCRTANTVFQGFSPVPASMRLHA